MDKHAGITGYIVTIMFAPALGSHQTDSELGVLRSRGVTQQGSNWHLVHLSRAGHMRGVSRCKWSICAGTCTPGRCIGLG